MLTLVLLLMRVRNALSKKHNVCLRHASLVLFALRGRQAPAGILFFPASAYRRTTLSKGSKYSVNIHKESWLT